MTHLTILWLGSAISAAVYALASVLPGSAVLGTMFFDTTVNSSPAIYRDAVETISFDDGVTNIMGQVNSSGGLVNISGAFSLTEVGGFASGALAIENPTTETIFCTEMSLYLSRMHLSATNVDIYAGTGSISEAVSPGILGVGTGSVVIANNYSLGTGSTIFSGAVLGMHGLALASNTSTTAVNQINVVSLAGTGSIPRLTGTYRVECYRTQ